MARAEEERRGYGPGGVLSRLEPPTGTKDPIFVLVGDCNRDKWALHPLPARLVIGLGTKTYIDSGPNGDWDKCWGSKPYYVVVFIYAYKIELGNTEAISGNRAATQEIEPLS